MNTKVTGPQVIQADTLNNNHRELEPTGFEIPQAVDTEPQGFKPVGKMRAELGKLLKPQGDPISEDNVATEESPEQKNKTPHQRSVLEHWRGNHRVTTTRLPRFQQRSQPKPLDVAMPIEGINEGVHTQIDWLPDVLGGMMPAELRGIKNKALPNQSSPRLDHGAKPKQPVGHQKSVGPAMRAKAIPGPHPVGQRYQPAVKDKGATNNKAGEPASPAPIAATALLPQVAEYLPQVTTQSQEVIGASRMEQLAQALLEALPKGIKHVRMVLPISELGSVEADVRVYGGDVNLVLHVPGGGIGDRIVSQIDILRDRFESQGLRLARLRIAKSGVKSKNKDKQGQGHAQLFTWIEG